MDDGWQEGHRRYFSGTPGAKYVKISIYEKNLVWCGRNGRRMCVLQIVPTLSFLLGAMIKKILATPTGLWWSLATNLPLHRGNRQNLEVAVITRNGKTFDERG